MTPADRDHDIANVLTAIEGAAAMLVSDTVFSAEDRATLGRLLQSGVGRLRSLVLNIDRNGEGMGETGAPGA